MIEIVIEKLQKGKSNFISDHKNLELDCEFDGEPFGGLKLCSSILVHLSTIQLCFSEAGEN